MLDDGYVGSLEVSEGGSHLAQVIAQPPFTARNLPQDSHDGQNELKGGVQIYDGYMLGGPSNTEFPFVFYSAPSSSRKRAVAVPIPRSLMFEASIDTSGSTQLNYGSLEDGVKALLTVDNDLGGIAVGFHTTWEYNHRPYSWDPAQKYGIWPTGELPRNGVHVYKSICVFSKHEPPRCATKHFGVLPTRGFDSRDFHPYVFFYCHISFRCELQNHKHHPERLPEIRTLELYVSEVLMPVGHHTILNDLEATIRLADWPCFRQHYHLPIPLDERQDNNSIRMLRIEQTGPYPKLPLSPVPVSVKLFVLEGNHLLFPASPRNKIVMGMMTRTKLKAHPNNQQTQVYSRFLRGPCAVGGCITAKIVYHQYNDFYVVYDYEVVDDRSQWLQTRQCMMNGMNEYRVKLNSGAPGHPGFYYTEELDSVLVEDPQSLLHGRRIEEAKDSYAWVRMNEDENRIAKLYISALDPPAEEDGSLEICSTGFLANECTGAVFCREYAQQRIFLPEECDRDRIVVGEYISFHAVYEAREKRFIIDDWINSWKRRVATKQIGSKYIFRDKLLYTRFVCAKKCVCGRAFDLISDKENIIWNYCCEKVVEMPVNVHAYMEENTDPERLTFFNVHSFDWAIAWDKVDHIYAAVDRPSEECRPLLARRFEPIDPKAPEWRTPPF